MSVSTLKTSFRLFSALAFCLAIPVFLWAAPDWWTTHGIDSNTADDAAPARVGQALHMADSAQKEMNVVWVGIGGAGAEVDALVATFPSFSEVDRNALLQFGQLRTLAAPFYQLLIQPEVGQLAALPTWLTEPSTADDTAIIKVGQLKYTFDFLIDVLSTDSDGDRLSDADEINVYGTDPNNPDSDGDGFEDGWEVIKGYSALANQGSTGAFGDPEGDRLANEVENMIGSSNSTVDSAETILSTGTKSGGDLAILLIGHGTFTVNETAIASSLSN